MAWVGYVITGITTALDIEGGRKQQEQEEHAANLRATQLEETATDILGESQRKKLEETRQKDLVASRAQAVAAFSGASGPDVVRILADIEGEGTYRESVALYEGEAEARRLHREADIARAGGAAAIETGRYRQVGAIARGASSLYGQYGGRDAQTT